MYFTWFWRCWSERTPPPFRPTDPRRCPGHQAVAPARCTPARTWTPPPVAEHTTKPRAKRSHGAAQGQEIGGKRSSLLCQLYSFVSDEARSSLKKLTLSSAVLMSKLMLDILSVKGALQTDTSLCRSEIWGCDHIFSRQLGPLNLETEHDICFHAPPSFSPWQNLCTTSDFVCFPLPNYTL